MRRADILDSRRKTNDLCLYTVKINRRDCGNEEDWKELEDDGYECKADAEKIACKCDSNECNGAPTKAASFAFAISIAAILAAIV